MIYRLLLLGLTFSVGTAAIAQSSTSPAGAASEAERATLDAATRKRLIDGAIARMNEGYVFPEKVPAIAKALRAGLAGKYRSISDPQAFVDAVNSDIEAVAHDRHMRLSWSPDPVPPLPDPDQIDLAMLRQQEEFMARRNYAIREAKVLDGNIGYLKINGFLPPEEAGLRCRRRWHS